MRNNRVLKSQSYDIFSTPDHAIKIIQSITPKNWKIWECAAGDGNIANFFKNESYPVISTDIETMQDFLTWKPLEDFDCIITNPPFSKKTQFMERACEIGKPWAFLLPLTALEGERRSKLYRKYNIQIIVPNKRIDFQKGNIWFQVAWFTWGFGLKNDINHVDISQPEIKIALSLKRHFQEMSRFFTYKKAMLKILTFFNIFKKE